VYEREYGGATFTLEASGGLLNSSLVMQDRETDSYWSIMTGEVVAGRLSGTKIIELPVSEKTKWKHWVQKYPETKVLSVNGREDTYSSYDDYFASDAGFRNQAATDTRLKTKDPIFTFEYQDKKYAVPFSAIEEGAAFVLNGARVFLYRPKNAQIFQSTAAYMTTGSGFVKEGRKWKDGIIGASTIPIRKFWDWKNNTSIINIAGFARDAPIDIRNVKSRDILHVSLRHPAFPAIKLYPNA
jgi:hypothetical protein